MLIVIQSPICLLMAIAHYGVSENTFIFVQDESSISRTRGRNIALRQEFVTQIFETSRLSYLNLTPDLAADYINHSNQDVAVDFQISGRLWQKRVFPLRQDSEFIRKLDLLSFGADNLLPFSNMTDKFRSVRAFKEHSIWSRLLRGFCADTVLVPAFSHGTKRTFVKTELLTLDCKTIFDVNFFTISRLISKYLPDLLKVSSIPTIIVSPDNLDIREKHISEIVAITNDLIFKLGEKVNVLIKPHPATSNANVLIEKISSLLSAKSINQAYDLNAELLKSIPLELLLNVFKDYYYVGVPSSALAFIDPIRASLVKTFDKKLDAHYTRNYRFFLKFHGFPRY